MNHYAAQLAAEHPPTPEAKPRLGLAEIAPTVGSAVLALFALAIAVWGFVGMLDVGSGVLAALAVAVVPGLAGLLLAAGAVRLAVAARR